jgi:hypothetical protein
MAGWYILNKDPWTKKEINSWGLNVGVPSIQGIKYGGPMLRETGAKDAWEEQLLHTWIIYATVG